MGIKYRVIEELVDLLEDRGTSTLGVYCMSRELPIIHELTLVVLIGLAPEVGRRNAASLITPSVIQF